MKDEYGDEMIRLLMEAHGYTAKEAEQSLAGGEGSGEGCSVIVVVEHKERSQQLPPTTTTTLMPRRQRRGDGGERARGLGGGGTRVRRQRDTTSRYGAGAFAVMEASLRGQGTDDGVT